MRRAHFLLALALLVPCCGAGAADLQEIIAAYGGIGALQSVGSSYSDQETCSLREASKNLPESQRCWVSKTYKKDGWTARMEMRISGRSTIEIIEKDRGTAFEDGSWLERAVSGQGGRNGYPMTSLQLNAFHTSLQSGVYTILLQAQTLGGTIVPGKTRDGKPADMLRMNIAGGVHEYLFDQQSHLCIEMHSGAASPRGITNVLGDYRTIQGLPVPFRYEVYHGANATPGEAVTLREIKFAQSFPDELFQPPQRLPLWFFPLAFCGVMIFAAIFIFVAVAQRSRAMKEESSIAPL